MMLFTLWDNTPANDNASTPRRPALARTALRLDTRETLAVLVLSFRVADNDGLPAVLCRQPVRS
jgi:hypothetical protein